MNMYGNHKVFAKKLLDACDDLDARLYSLHSRFIDKDVPTQWRLPRKDTSLRAYLGAENASSKDMICHMRQLLEGKGIKKFGNNYNMLVWQCLQEISAKLNPGRRPA